MVQAAALPTLGDPCQRARYTWEAFSAGMDDVTAGTSGWRIRGAGRIAPCGYYEGIEFLNLAEVHFRRDRDPRFRRLDDRPGDPELIIERHREISLDVVEEARLREREERGEVRTRSLPTIAEPRPSWRFPNPAPSTTSAPL